MLKKGRNLYTDLKNQSFTIKDTNQYQPSEETCMVSSGKVTNTEGPGPVESGFITHLVHRCVYQLGSSSRASSLKWSEFLIGVSLHRLD